MPLPGEPAPFKPFIDETYFCMLYPNLQINVTHDCFWWMRMLPVSEDETRVTLGFCFPRETVARPRFSEEASRRESNPRSPLVDAPPVCARLESFLPRAAGGDIHPALAHRRI